ncbi:SusC/RagA family TonB-linked outer membrane protein [Aquimarina sp. SS2-1]|uniref:SusC/RagA family TonB-linked outer membrane protein n=1 Tax=Aquimarina besae TaxID=3342247 RepID=UPI00366FC305
MKLSFLTILLFTGILHQGLAQKMIKGTVTDPTGTPLPGASVLIQGTTTGTLSDFDGIFEIKAKEGAIIEISYVGFETTNFVVTKEDEYTIQLNEEIDQLDQVIVVGYGTQRKAILTSSVSSVDGDDLAAEPVLNPLQALQGNAAGVQITSSDAPGQAPNVIIRGLGTIQGGRDPLYVVDGILTNNINNINSSDIERIDVLKDAASLAIYGNRGANGVIIVTTKKGRSGKMEINFDSFTGFRDIVTRVEMADASSFVTFSNEARRRDLRRDGDPNNDNDTTGFLLANQQYNTNWLDEITRQGIITNNNLSLSGGSDNIRSFFSMGFNKEEGILLGNDFDRLTLRSNTDYRISDSFTFSNNVSVQLANATPKSFNAFTNAYKQAPIIPVRDENGNFGTSIGLNNVSNPVKDLFFQDEDQKFFKIQGTFKLDYKVIEPLTVTSRFSIENEYARFYQFVNLLGLFLADDPTRTEADYFRVEEDLPRTILRAEQSNIYRWFWDNYLTFDKRFADVHGIKVTLGITTEEGKREFLVGTRENVPTDRNLRFNLNTGDLVEQTPAGGSISDGFGRLFSYIARVNYDFNDKYLLNASYRRDGASKFTRGKRFGDFYAVSAGWVVSEESFMENSIFDVLKFRASYGELGNQNTPPNILNVTTGDGGFYSFGPDEELQQGITITGAIDEELTWEITNEIDFGVEFSVFNRRLTGEMDYYKRTNTNAILQIQLPDVFGFEPFNSHVGEIVNEGFEASFNWSDAIGELRYTLSSNFTYNQNELTKVTNPFFNEQDGGSIDNGQFTKRVTVGRPLGSFFLYDVIGIDDRGELVYDDVNNNGIVDEGDRKYFGSYIPKIVIGSSLSVDYKNFDFSIETLANLGNEVYNGKKAQRFGNENVEQQVFNRRWTSGRPSNTDPIASNDVPLSSTYFLESGDFFRINNITLGYTIPEDASGPFSKIRVYTTARNPIIFQKFSGFTPELVGDPLGTAGIELNAYPSLRSFYVGLNVSF